MSATDRAGAQPAAARAVVILAGGRATRFGSDKTRVEVDGIALLDRVLGVVGALRPPVDEVLVVGPWAPPGVRHVIEPERFEGPLAALAFGLSEIASSTVLVLAADHADLQPALLELLLARLAADETVDVVVPVRDDRREPLVAAYRRAVGTLAAELVAQGTRSLQALLDVIATVEISEDEWRAVDLEGRSFLDIDRVEDLRDVDP